MGEVGPTTNTTQTRHREKQHTVLAKHSSLVTITFELNKFWFGGERESTTISTARQHTTQSPIAHFQHAMLHDKTTSSTSSLVAPIPVLPGLEREMISRHRSARALSYPRRNHSNVGKPYHLGGHYNYATMDRLYLPSLDDAQRDGPPRCVSPIEESDNEERYGEEMDCSDSLMADDDFTPLDYHVDPSKELYAVVSECLRSHPSLLISSEDVTMTEFHSPAVETSAAAWESLNLEHSLGVLEDC